MSHEANPPIQWRTLWGPLVGIAPHASAWIQAFSCVSTVPKVVGPTTPDLHARWWGTTIGSIDVVGCSASDESAWSSGARTMMGARYPVSLGLGLRASGCVGSDFVVAPALEEGAAQRFFLEPSAALPRGLFGALSEVAQGRFAILTDTQVYLDPNPAHDLDRVAPFLARFAELVAARQWELGPTPAQRDRATALAEALSAHATTVDPFHDSVLVRRDDFAVEVTHCPDIWDPYTHVQLTFPIALGPPFVVRGASGLVPQLLANDTAIGDSELDRKLEISTLDAAALAAVLRGPLREPILALRERHPTFTFTERALDVTMRGAFSVTSTAALVEELLALVSCLTAPRVAQPYR